MFRFVVRRNLQTLLYAESPSKLKKCPRYIIEPENHEKSNKIYGLFRKLSKAPMERRYEDIVNFKFHEPFTEPEDSTNGLCFGNTYLPEELVLLILSNLDAENILKCSLVCKKWCNIAKSYSLWSQKYARKYNKRPKKFPWYIFYCLFSTNYFDVNLIENGNGQKLFMHWRLVRNYGDGFRIEDPPQGSDPLPADVPEFNGFTSCFATSYQACDKLQEISFRNNPLMLYIVNNFKPHIYLSEWVAGRFDCGCKYKLKCVLCSNMKASSGDDEFQDSTEGYDYGGMRETDILKSYQEEHMVEQWQGREWKQIKMLVKDYPAGVTSIVFQHVGRDTQFWAGHYGSKMAGGVLKILLDSMDEQGITSKESASLTRSEGHSQ